MKKLSETYKKMGIAFTFPIEIKDAKGYRTYYENSEGRWDKHERDTQGWLTRYENSDDYWEKWERDANGNLTYYEDSDGDQRGTPRSTTNQ